MKRFVPALIALLLQTQPLHAATPLTLDEALATALKRHPQIAEAKENLSGAEARTGQALANYYPQIGIAADWSRGRTFLTALERVKTTQVALNALYLNQTIYDFGRTAGAVDAAIGNRDAADQALTLTRQDLTLRVKSAFYLLLAAEQQVAATGETVKAREGVHRQALEFFNHGVRAKVDVARAEANLYAARTALIRARNGLDMARVELANAMGVTSLEQYAPVAAAPMPATLPDRGQAYRNALGNRAELQQLSALERAADANLRTAKGSYLPILSGTASVGYADRDFPPTGNVWGVALNLTMPIFSGFSSREQVREARANIGAILARQHDLQLQIAKEVESAWLGVNEASARIASTQKGAAAADENKALAEGRYQEGVGSIIEVTDAQSLALEAQTAHIQAQYDYYTELARLERTMGRL